MVKYAECKFRRDRSLTISQAVAIFLAIVALAFGITCIVFTGKPPWQTDVELILSCVRGVVLRCLDFSYVRVCSQFLA